MKQDLHGLLPGAGAMLDVCNAGGIPFGWNNFIAGVGTLTDVSELAHRLGLSH